jgi:hypothetical protein
MTEAVLSLRGLNSENMKYETTRNFLQLYITSIVIWLFILWSFGCDFNKSSMVRNLLIASYLIMVLTKNKGWYSTDVAEIKDISGKKNVTSINKSISNIDLYKPTISYSLLMVFIFSAVYLLDWEEKWQKWPVPTIFAAFLGSIIDELLILG